MTQMKEKEKCGRKENVEEKGGREGGQRSKSWRKGDGMGTEGEGKRSSKEEERKSKKEGKELR